jgi:ferrochelatase
MTLPYQAVMIVSFGGPEGMQDVMPFLENVLRGRNVPEERKLEVAHHYEQFGGVSPINGHNRELQKLLQAELDRQGVPLKVYWGNRNWTPYIDDVVAQMKADGVKRALAYTTSAYSSYSGCRQYRENIGVACAKTGDGAPVFDKIRVFYNHPEFIGVNAANIQACLDRIPSERRSTTHLVFTAHSIPLSMAGGCDYEKQLREACRLTAEAAGIADFQLAFQSRSGPPTQPWLEPDILAHLETLRPRGVTDVVVAPIGFVSDHMEVLFDLDVEASEKAQSLGLGFQRVPCVGNHPRFVSMVCELIRERLVEQPVRRALGDRGPNHDVCPVNCCLPARRPSAIAAE